MHELGFTDTGAMALLISILMGTLAFALVLRWEVGHDCANRYCPHRKRHQNDPYDRTGE